MTIRGLQTVYEKVLNGPWVTLGDDVQVYLEDGTLYVECSDGRSDWRHNFMFGIKPYSNSNIKILGHRGFTKLWLSIKKDIEAMNFNRVIAYSQGGGIAHYIHENYYHRTGKHCETWAFGSPNTFVNPCSELRYRMQGFHHVINPFELVHMNPPGALGYTRIGDEHVLRGTARKPKDVPLWQWLSGHTPSEYMQRLATTKDAMLQ